MNKTTNDKIQDIYTEIDTMVTVVLTNVKFMTNTPIITDQAEEQDVYEGYSNVGGGRKISQPFILT